MEEEGPNILLILNGGRGGKVTEMTDLRDNVHRGTKTKLMTVQKSVVH